MIEARIAYFTAELNLVCIFTAVTFRGVATGGIWCIYTLSKSGQVNFFWGNNDVRTVIELFIPPQNKFLATPL